jgi:type I restriction enzyme R subunit
MRAFLEKKIIQMLKQNGGRINFAERYQQMIDRYNSGATATEQLFEEIQKFTKGLQEEDQRHIREGLTEDELEIYDLLLKDKLTKDEQQQVKLAAKDLIAALINTTPKVLVQDWWKDGQTQALVKDEIEKVLDKDLPVSYDVTQFQEKVSTVFELVKNLAMNDDKWVS